MKSKILLTTVMCLLVTIWLINQPLFGQEFQSNSFIIKAKSNKALEPILLDLNATIVDSIAGKDIFLVNYSSGLEIAQVVSNVKKIKDVVFSQPNYITSIPEAEQGSQSFPDEECPGLDYNTSPPMYFGHPGILSIGADSANLISTGENVVVAVIDNGIAFNHPLFENALAGTGYDFYSNDTDPSEEPGDALGHGTFVSGIIRRIALGCQLVPLRAFNGDGYGHVFAISEAIYWAIDNNVDVINMSFSMGISNPLIEEAVSDAEEAGIYLVAASGNNGLELTTYPAGYNDVIGVSAIDESEVRADFSNYGSYINVCAPGVNIYSSLAGEYEWGTWSGTSFSAPMVSAVCAIIKSKASVRGSNIDIIDIIQSTARTELQWGTINPYDNEYGYGCIDAFNAVLSVVKGDVDASGDLNILDIDYLTRHVYYGGPAPVPVYQVGDMDNSGVLDQDDIDELTKQVFKTK
jgi:subtilisin family serine protease